MLPGGFKKDSRVWLHKNAHVFPRKTFVSGTYNGPRLCSDDPYDQSMEDPSLISSPLITDATGRIFKKDSRTWLHKSSFKKFAVNLTHGAIRMAAASDKISMWRQKVRLNKNQMNAGENLGGVVRARSSTEIVRSHNGVNKVKKVKNVGFNTDRTLATTWETQSIQEVALKSRRQASASLHSMKIKKKGNCEVSAYASDFCIVSQKKSVVEMTTIGNSDTDFEDENEDSYDSCRPNDKCKGSSINHPVCLIEDEAAMGMGYNNTTVEITKDGLRELEKMMKEQHKRRSLRLAKSSREGTPVCPETVSSDSKASLDACISLSEEFGCGKEICQPQNSAEQLTQATEYLHVCSPNPPTPHDPKRPRGDS